MALLAIAVASPRAAVATDTSFTVRPSVHQVAVLDAPPGAVVRLLRNGERLQEAPIDSLGSHLFRNVESGQGYRVRVIDGTRLRRSTAFEVLDAKATPDPSLYAGQVLPTSNLGPNAGYGYLSVGANAEYKLAFVPECLGDWSAHANATYYNLGSGTSGAGVDAIRNHDQHEVVFGGGLRVAF